MKSCLCSSGEDKDSEIYKQKKNLILKIKILLNSLDGHLEINLYSYASKHLLCQAYCQKKGCLQR